jgi:hypothetical protein
MRLRYSIKPAIKGEWATVQFIEPSKKKKRADPDQIDRIDKIIILLVILCTYGYLTSFLNKSTSFVNSFILREYRNLYDYLFVINSDRAWLGSEK